MKNNIKLDVKKSNIFSNVKIFQPSVSKDIRGDIYTSYKEDLYSTSIPNEIVFKHDKFSKSKKNVLRGLHGDNKTWKLISCVYGEILEVIVDYNKSSNTYLKWEKYKISGDNKKQILIPPNYVNGFLVLSDIAIFHYKLAYDGEYFDVQNQYVVKWNDKRLNIPWPCDAPILQERDK